MLLCMALLAMPTAVLAEDHGVSEYAVKTALVFKIAKFVNWPDDAFVDSEGGMNICVPEGSPFIEHMELLNGRQVHGRGVQIVQFSKSAGLKAPCQVLVISKEDDEQVTAALTNATAGPVLTIGDSEKFAEHGGIVGLKLERSRVSFVINVAVSQSVGLDIHAQLLQLATIVSTEEA